MSLGPQCRKCRQRRVRCDSRLPACLKCAENGIAGPRHSTSRPLRWKHYLPCGKAACTESTKPGGTVHKE
ncbi:hypothetical protein BJX64DRAFT_252600 [Aspergillus heterothallicus]